MNRDLNGLKQDERGRLYKLVDGRRVEGGGIPQPKMVFRMGHEHGHVWHVTATGATVEPCARPSCIVCKENEHEPGNS